MTKTIERIAVQGQLPESFFTLAAKPYEALHFRPDEHRETTAQVFRLEAEQNEIMLYTDHQSLRLIGIFPLHSAEAFFGFWETADELALNQEAFTLLEKDAQARGRKAVIGPVNFNTFHRYRLRLKEPSWGMFDREPVNPGYYPRLLEQLGYAIRSTFQSRLIRKETVPELYTDKQALLESLPALPFEFIPLDVLSWQRYEDEIQPLADQVFSANPGYRTISPEQFQLLYNRAFAEKLCPHSSVLFRDKASGRLVAMSFCQPHYPVLPGYSPSFERDFAALPTKVLLVKSVGVHPEFRQKGLMSYLGAYAMLSFRALYEEVIFCLMRSDNISLHFSNDYPYESTQYALFHKLLID